MGPQKFNRRLSSNPIPSVLVISRQQYQALGAKIEGLMEVARMDRTKSTETQPYRVEVLKIRQMYKNAYWKDDNGSLRRVFPKVK